MASTIAKTTAKTAAKAAATALRQRRNERSAVYFAAGCLALIALFTALRVGGILMRRWSPNNHGVFMRVVLSATRRMKSTLIRKIFGFPSIGHMMVYIIYLMVNILLAFYRVDWSAGTLNNWAKRMGWVTASNLTLVTFLALKNTPLAFLTAYSYERLNVLHRFAGYTTIASMLVHSIVYLKAFAVSNTLSEIAELNNSMGVVAGVALLTIFTTAVLLRRLRYEVFYVIHVAMFMLILIAVGMHRPDIAKNTVWIPIFCAAIWFCDRVLRSTRIIYYAYNNFATVTPLPHGAVRVVLGRSSRRAQGGTHIFLWMPSIRAAETHPFTVSSVSPLEIVVSAHDGFTRDLLNYATKNPGGRLRASMDGPYGTVPNFVSYDYIVLIAGGSGASFTFGIAVDLVQQLSPDSNTRINFIWVVRETETLSWYAKELQVLLASPLLTLTIHVTNHHHASTSYPAPLHLTDRINPEKPPAASYNGSPLRSLPDSLSEKVPHSESGSFDIEGISPEANEEIWPAGMEIKPGRPDVKALLCSIVGAARRKQKVIVAACGPMELTESTRSTIVGITSGGGGRDVELHVEQFGW